MSVTTRIASIALAAAMAGMVVGCSENTDQPDIGEGFEDITDGTSTTGDATTDTSATEPTAEKPKTAEQADADGALKDRRTQMHANDRVSKAPLKAE